MKSYEHLRVVRDERGVVSVAFDVRNRPVNVFEEQLFLELSEVVAELEQDRSARLIVFRSDKESGFLAGADVHRIHRLTDAAEAERALRAGQELFERIEHLDVPTVAVIHGNCLGGGLELALACSHRIARNDSSTRLGLPETQLGLLPGWGGTQRLPRRVGLQLALKMILTGSPLSAEKSKRAGLVDQVAAPEHFEAEVSELIDRLLRGNRPGPASRGWLSAVVDGTGLGRAIVFRMARREIARQAKHYPALPAVLRAVEAGYRDGMDAGFAREREEFGRLLFTPTCRNLVELFLRRERARARETWVSSGEVPSVPVRTIAVLGAGTMGAGIAQLAATRQFKVILKDIDEAAVRRGMEQVASLMRKGVKKGALQSRDADAALAAIIPTTESRPLSEADLVIEAVVERLDVKQQVFRELDEQLPPGVVIVSNTSALTISELSAVTNRPERVAGLHFFNPVHRMPLVEIVRPVGTSDTTVAQLVDVVKALGKTPVVVAEGPGFLVNRVLFPYLDEAVRLVFEGQSVEDVDREAKRFGMPMGPLELLDAVGIDIAADVSRNLAAIGFGDGPTPEFLAEMAAQGRLGQKSGAGFYRYRRGRRRGPSRGAAGRGKPATPSPQEFAGERLSGVQQRLVLSLMNAAGEVLYERIVAAPWIVDLGLVLGTGFAPFRGGPLRLAEGWGHEKVVKSLESLARQCGPRFRPSPYFTHTSAAADSRSSDRSVRV